MSRRNDPNPQYPTNLPRENALHVAGSSADHQCPSWLDTPDVNRARYGEIIDTSLYRDTSLDLGQLWQLEGWYFSFNPTYDRSWSLFGGGATANAMANWVIKNVK